VIRQVALYFPCAEDVAAAGLPVVGRPLAFRVLLAAVRAGARRVALPAALRSPELEAALATSPSARAAVAWLDAPGALAPEPVLLLPAVTLTPAPALARLLSAPPGRLLAESRGAGAPVLTTDRPLAGLVQAAVMDGAPLEHLLEREFKAGDLPEVASERWLVRVDGPAAAATAEFRLWSELGSPIDTWLDVTLHRRLSRWVTRAAVPLGVSPNAVTVASGLVGLAAAATFAHGEVPALVAGLLLYLVAVVLDHTDGEMARLTLRESAVGEWLDIVLDTVVHTALVLALGHAAAGVTGTGHAAGVAIALGVLASAIVGKRWPPAPPAAAERGLLDALTARDGFYAMLLLFIVLRVAAPALLPALLVIVAVGTHVYWLARLLSRARPAPG
jgi:phosphatidylglycerophosphate synthase